MLTEEQKESLKWWVLAVFTVVVCGKAFYDWRTEKNSPRTYQEAPSKKKTVVVYGKKPRSYRCSGFVEVIDIHNAYEKFTIKDYYTIKECTDGRGGAFKCTTCPNPEVNMAERGDTLLVASQGDSTWEVIRNITAERVAGIRR